MAACWAVMLTKQSFFLSEPEPLGQIIYHIDNTLGLG